MKNILFTLALLISFSSFGQDDIDYSSAKSIKYFFEQNPVQSNIEGYWMSYGGSVYIIKKKNKYYMIGTAENGTFEEHGSGVEWVYKKISRTFAGDTLGVFSQKSNKEFFYKGYLLKSCATKYCRNKNWKESLKGYTLFKKVSKTSFYTKYVEQPVIVDFYSFRLSNI